MQDMHSHRSGVSLLIFLSRMMAFSSLDSISTIHSLHIHFIHFHFRFQLVFSQSPLYPFPARSSQPTPKIPANSSHCQRNRFIPGEYHTRMPFPFPFNCFFRPCLPITDPHTKHPHLVLLS